MLLLKSGLPNSKLLLVQTYKRRLWFTASFLYCEHHNWFGPAKILRHNYRSDPCRLRPYLSIVGFFFLLNHLLAVSQSPTIETPVNNEQYFTFFELMSPTFVIWGQRSINSVWQLCCCFTDLPGGACSSWVHVGFLLSWFAVQKPVQEE